MSLQINQKKEAFLASDDLFRPSGLAVPVAGVSPISNYIHQAHHLNRPAMSLHPGRVRAARICVNLRHYRFLQSVPAPVFSACNLVLSPGQNAGVITPENYAPLESEPHRRLHNFRVGAAGPINLRPVFSRSFTPAMSRPIYCIKAKLKVIVTSGECKEARTAVTFAGVVSIRIGGMALRSGKQCDVKPRRAILTTTETGSTWESQRDSSNNPNQPCVSSLLKPENFAARFRFSCYPKRSSAATCADYTCFPAGSRRQAPFLSLPAPHDGARHNFPVRCKSASLTQVYSPGRFRASHRRAQSPMRTVGRGPVFDNSPSKSGAVKPGFF